MPIDKVVGLVIVAIGAFLSLPFGKSTDRKSDSNLTSGTYENKSKRARLGNILPIIYGEYDMYPDLINDPFISSKNGVEFINAAYCIGFGNYDVLQTRLGSSVVDAQSNVEILRDNNPVSIFDVATYTVDSVNYQELFIQSERVREFICTPESVLCNQITIAIEAPYGMFDGLISKNERSRHVRITYKRLDAAGTVTQRYRMFASQSSTFWQEAVQDLPEGRYQVSLYTEEDVKDTYFDQNRLFVKFITARLTGQGQQKFGYSTIAALSYPKPPLQDGNTDMVNVVVSKKLPAWDPATKTWKAAATSSSMVWAFYDILKTCSDMDESNVDLPALAALDQELTNEGSFFNGIYDRETNSLEALMLCLKSCRCSMIFEHNKLAIIRDVKKDNFTAIFSRQNILMNSFRVNFSLYDFYDAVDMGFISKDNGWKEKRIKIDHLGNTSPSNALGSELFGRTTQTEADKEALFYAKCRFYRGERIEFNTELEGYLCSVGDVILVTHDLLDDNITGRIDNIDHLTGIISVKQDIASASFLTFQNLNGTPSSKVEIEVVSATEFKIKGAATYTYSSNNGFNQAHIKMASNNEEIELFYGGSGSIFVLGDLRRYKVQSVTPRDNFVVSINAIYDPIEVYT